MGMPCLASTAKSTKRHRRTGFAGLCALAALALLCLQPWLQFSLLCRLRFSSEVGSDSSVQVFPWHACTHGRAEAWSHAAMPRARRAWHLLLYLFTALLGLIPDFSSGHDHDLRERLPPGCLNCAVFCRESGASALQPPSVSTLYTIPLRQINQQLEPGFA